VPPARRRLSAKIRLPILELGTDDIGAWLSSGRPGGLVLLIARCCGLALDSGRESWNGSPAYFWSPHGQRQQLWYLQAKGRRKEFMLISASGGLALDATAEKTDGRGTLMWEPHGAEWQRWRLVRSPDGISHEIVSVHDGRVLAANQATVPGWTPWMEDRHGGWDQQWLITVPHGEPI
jgi:hypothetical protein